MFEFRLASQLPVLLAESMPIINLPPSGGKFYKMYFAVMLLCSHSERKNAKEIKEIQEEKERRERESQKERESIFCFTCKITS